MGSPEAGAEKEFGVKDGLLGINVYKKNEEKAAFREEEAELQWMKRQGVINIMRKTKSIQDKDQYKQNEKLIPGEGERKKCVINILKEGWENIISINQEWDNKKRKTIT